MVPPSLMKGEGVSSLLLSLLMVFSVCDARFLSMRPDRLFAKHASTPLRGEAPGLQKTIFVHQSHTDDFWSVAGDDAGTLSKKHHFLNSQRECTHTCEYRASAMFLTATMAGEVGFIYLEWTGYTDYDYVTIYQVRDPIFRVVGHENQLNISHQG